MTVPVQRPRQGMGNGLWSWRIFAVALVGALLAACSPAAPPASGGSSSAPTGASAAPASKPAATGALADLQKSGKVVVGYANTRPMSFLDASGDLTGAAIEVTKAAFADLGVPKVEGVLIDFTGLIPALQAKQFDTIAAGIAIRPERCQQVAFARPFLTNPYIFVYKDSSATKFTDFKSIAAAGARFAGQSGAAEVGLAKADGVTIVEFPDLASIEAGLKAGRGDVMITVPANVGTVMQDLGAGWTQSPVYAPLDASGKPAYSVLALAFRLDDTATVQQMNAELDKLYQSGRLAGFVQPFGYTKDAIDLAMKYTASDLCTPAS